MSSRRPLLFCFRWPGSAIAATNGCWGRRRAWSKSKIALMLFAMSAVSFLAEAPAILALNPSMDISQYAHTAWTTQQGFSPGTTFAMAQTPDGYLWLGSEFGVFRFDGVSFIPWKPPAGQHLPESPYSLLVTRDGTLWIGTYAGLASWKDGKLTQYPGLEKRFVTSLLEDRDGTVWAGTLGGSPGTGRLCAIRGGGAECYGQDGAFGSFVWSLGEDRSGALWAGAESGLWRWKPGSPQRFATPGTRTGDMVQDDDGRLIIGLSGAGLAQIDGDKVETYPIHSAISPKELLRDHDVDSNKLLWDHDGGLWIGTHQRGLIHVHHARTDVFKKSDGLSGDIIAGLFEDREGNIWVSTSGGLDRFRELPFTAISTKQGLSSDNANSVLAATDGSVWVGTRDGLTRWQNRQTTIFRKANGLPDDFVQSLFQDDRGRIWATFPGHGLGYLKNDRFVAVPGVPSAEVYSITGDKSGNLWLSGNEGLSHLLDGHLVEHFPWSALGRHQQAKTIVFDPAQGGIWLSFWQEGGIEYFKDGRVRASYTPADGLAKGPVAGLRLHRDGSVWAATELGGLSRIKNGRLATLTTRNGLPCDTIHWTIEDDKRSLWMDTACGIVRIVSSELDAWIADPNRRVQTTLWDAADGVRLRTAAASSFGPTVAKSVDGKIWLLTGEGVQVVDPGHPGENKLPPPVHIEKVEADDKTYWQNLPGAAISNLRLPPHTRNLQIFYTALSLVAPEKVRFKYKLEGQDIEWREVVNDRDVQYSNLPPRHYRFRVIACNNSGVWNEQGDALEFSVDPAFYQTNWFRALCAVLLLALVWAIHQMRVRQLHHDFTLTLEARVRERISIARELHDTLLQSFQGLMLRFEIVSQFLPDRPIEAKEKLEGAMKQAADAITEGRDAVQGLRASTVQTNDLARATNALGEELASDPANHGSPAFRVTVEGGPRDLHPILRDEIYRIATEALRNAFHHAQARQVEVEIRYDNQQFRLRVRDDGKGIDPAVLSGHGREGHFGLPGMRERAKAIGGKLVVWSEVGSGTEVELHIPAEAAYARAAKRSWLSELLAKK